MLELNLRAVELGYPGLAAPVLTLPELTLPSGSHTAVTGPSGSGKTTLVNVLAGLERVGKGHVRWNGTDIAALTEGGRDRWRGANVGLVMQDFHLFPGLSALDNILLPARLARKADTALRDRAATLMQRVGLSRPEQDIETMSRGEMQRVAVARALVRRPGVIIADEPTASLDAANGAALATLLVELAAQSGATLVIVSHDPRLIDSVPRRITMAQGRIVADNGSEGPA